MNNKTTIGVILIIFFAVGRIYGDIYWDDGESHQISSSGNGKVYLDYNIVNSPGTNLNLITGGALDSLGTHNNSFAVNNGGSIFSLESFDHSIITLSTGSIGWRTVARDNSVIHIYGGSLGEWVNAYDSGVVYFYGSNFTINGTALKYGDSLRDYADLDYHGNYYHDFFSGTWYDGTTFHTGFNIERYSDADIIIIPEPATLLLFSLGAVLVRKRKM